MTKKIMNYPERTAENLIKKYKTSDPFYLCSLLNIICLNVNLPASVDGFYQKIENTKIIYLNDSLNDTKKRYCLAHELGHAIMHEDLNFLFISYQTRFILQKYENEADRFATSLLMSYYNYDKFFIKSEQVTFNQLSIQSGIPQKFLENYFSSKII